MCKYFHENVWKNRLWREDSPRVFKKEKLRLRRSFNKVKTWFQCLWILRNTTTRQQKSISRHAHRHIASLSNILLFFIESLSLSLLSKTHTVHTEKIFILVVLRVSFPPSTNIPDFALAAGRILLNIYSTKIQFSPPIKIVWKDLTRNQMERIRSWNIRQCWCP